MQRNWYKIYCTGIVDSSKQELSASQSKTCSPADPERDVRHARPRHSSNEDELEHQEFEHPV